MIAAQRCAKGQTLFSKWANRVRLAHADNWQRIFFHPTMYGYATHVKDCPQCQAVFESRHKPQEEP